MADEKFECSVCLKFFRPSSSGLLRLHGPQSSRCPGSHQVVHQQSSSSSSSIVATCPQGASLSDCSGSSSPAVTPQPSPAQSLSFLPRVPTILRLPKASRRLAVEKFSALLEGVVRDNTPSLWVSLLLFTSNCLYSPLRGGRRLSLATIINKQLEDGSGRLHQPSRSFPGSLPPEYLRNAVSSRLEEGDFRGAIRLASASESLAPHSAATFRSLLDKHPSLSSSSSPPPPAPTSIFPVTEPEVARAILSFPQGSSGGPDNLRPQLLKDMLSIEPQVPGHSRLLSSLAAFSSLVLEGRTPDFLFWCEAHSLTKERWRDQTDHCGLFSSSIGCRDCV